MREARCCSFFRFALTVTGDELALEISTPAAQAVVLDALIDRARSAAGLVSQ